MRPQVFDGLVLARNLHEQLTAPKLMVPEVRPPRPVDSAKRRLTLGGIGGVDLPAPEWIEHQHRWGLSRERIRGDGSYRTFFQSCLDCGMERVVT